MAELDAENRAAWELFERVVTRFTVETHTLGPVLMRMAEADDPDDLMDLMTRLSILYDAYYPPPKKAKKVTRGA